MSRIGIYSHGPSNSATILKDEFLDLNMQATKLRTVNSNFVGRPDDFIINYGSSNTTELSRVVGSGTLLNHYDAVRRSSNKLAAFDIMSSGGVKTIDFTTSRQTARNWVEDGDMVYCREELNGHSGAGIIVASNSEVEIPGNVPVVTGNRIPAVSLFTRGMTERHRELRVHVAFGEIILVQQKRRVANWREVESYSMAVRNFDNGWIYATSNVALNQEAIDNSLLAVESLGLDFGAVDVITRGEEAWVLEVNTAPGLQGVSSRAAYVTAFVEHINSVNDDRNSPESSTDENSWEPVTGPAAFDIPDAWALPADGEVTFNPTTTPSVSTSTESFIERIRRDVEAMRAQEMQAQVATDSSTSSDFTGDLWDTPNAVPAPEVPATGRPSLRRAPSPVGGASINPPPVAASDNPMSSQGEVQLPPSAIAIDGTGFYTIEISPGVRTVAYVSPDGTIYATEQDVVVQESDISVINKIAV